MAKKAKKKTSKRERGRIAALEVEITSSRTALKDVEDAIAEKLAMQRTDLFREHDKVIIVLEKIGKPHSEL